MSLCLLCVFRKAPVPTREGIPTCKTIEISKPEVPQGDYSVQLSDGSLQSSAVELHTSQVNANEEAGAVIDSIINENQTTASSDSFLDRCVSIFREATPGRIIPCHRTMALEEISLFLAIHDKYLSSIRQLPPNFPRKLVLLFINETLVFSLCFLSCCLPRSSASLWKGKDF